MTEKVSLITKIYGWISLSRPPFHSVGILPFMLGTLLAWKLEHIFHGSVFILGTCAVILVMLSTYQAGEYFDYEEDSLSRNIFKSRFAGGSGVTQAGTLSRKVPLITSMIAIVAAAVMGLILQFGLKTGPYTIALGAIGLFGGFFYSTRPIRLVEKGIGEIIIGFCYGWLPVAAAFYIQTGYVHPIIHWMGLPIGMTIFNVILLNEFLDYTADKATGKKNILVRLARKRGARLYAALSVGSWVAMFLSLTAGVSPTALYVYIPVMILSAFTAAAVLKGKYKNYNSLEILCGLNIVVNLGTTISYIVAFI